MQYLSSENKLANLDIQVCTFEGFGDVVGKYARGWYLENVRYLYPHGQHKQHLAYPLMYLRMSFVTIIAS